ncbi:MAG: aldo/keto reductase [Acidimicrobiia bacterium]|nr:aldo/keto reductase [Acidimicrobiia bacterium]
MLLKKLGKTDQRISAIGIGVTATGGSGSSSRESNLNRVYGIRAGVDLGLTFIDTAELYGGGQSERIIGEAVAGIRDQVFLATKFRPEHASATGIRQALEGSLRRLNTEWVDLYQMHWPGSPCRFPTDETVESLVKLRAEGKIRHIGLSNFTTAEFEHTQYASNCIIVSNQLEYNPKERSIELEWIPFAERTDITTIAYSPFSQGSLQIDSPEFEKIREIAQAHEVTVHQIILAWVVSKPTVITVPKAANVDHVRQNAGALDIRLTTEELNKIDEASFREIKQVEPYRIRIGNLRGKPGYLSRKEAEENKLDLVPDPRGLADNIRRWGIQKPLPLAVISDADEPYEYEMIGNNLLYWAWVLAWGTDRPVPAYVFGKYEARGR